MRLRDLLVLAAFLASPAWAISPDSTDADAIMREVEDRDLGDRGTSRMQIVVTDKAGHSRTRTVQTRGMKFDGGRRELMLFDSPAELRNAGLLSVDFDEGSATDDQWLYLPSMNRTTRIAGSEKSSSFMGTDLTYADMTKADPDDYAYTMVEVNAEAGGEAAWLIEARPVTDKAKEETGYLKTQVWVSKDKLVPLQAKAWVIAGKKLKYTEYKNWKKVDGVWIAHETVVRTTRDGALLSTSVLTTSDVRFGVDDVTEADFTQQRLERGL